MNELPAHIDPVATFSETKLIPERCQAGLLVFKKYIYQRTHRIMMKHFPIPIPGLIRLDDLHFPPGILYPAGEYLHGMNGVRLFFQQLPSPVPEVGFRKGYHGFPFHFQPARSEEHTSELQSLMRISYAVFCLKKKNTKQTT